MSDDEIIAILGAPFVVAMGGIKEVTRRGNPVETYYRYCASNRRPNIEQLSPMPKLQWHWSDALFRRFA
jgi:hypothetical protein